MSIGSGTSDDGEEGIERGSPSTWGRTDPLQHSKACSELALRDGLGGHAVGRPLDSAGDEDDIFTIGGNLVPCATAEEVEVVSATYGLAWKDDLIRSTRWRAGVGHRLVDDGDSAHDGAAPHAHLWEVRRVGYHLAHGVGMVSGGASRPEPGKV